jgi:hypothetical protein
MKDDRINSRYRPLGGIHNVCEKYASGDVTLKEVAEKTTLSTRTVRNHLKKVLGLNGYAQIMDKRREARRHMSPPFWLKARTQSHLITSLGHQFLEDVDEILSLKRDLLKNAPCIKDVFLGKTGITRALTISGKVICIRNVHSRKDLKEHKIGFIRIKISPNQTSNFDFFIFKINDQQEKIYYIFAADKLLNQWSLNLRLPTSNKPSKYNVARNNWEILR